MLVCVYVRVCVFLLGEGGLCVCVCMHISASVCVCERERERELDSNSLSKFSSSLSLSLAHCRHVSKCVSMKVYLKAFICISYDVGNFVDQAQLSIHPCCVCCLLSVKEVLLNFCTYRCAWYNVNISLQRLKATDKRIKASLSVSVSLSLSLSRGVQDLTQTVRTDLNVAVGKFTPFCP